MVTTLHWDGTGREWRVLYGEAEGADGGRCPQVAGLHQGLPSITRQRKEAIGQAFLQKEPGGMVEGVRGAPFSTLPGGPSMWEYLLQGKEAVESRERSS